MPTLSSASAFAGAPDNATPIDRNVLMGGAAVIAIHIALLALVLTARETPPRPVESKTITAQLISEAPPQPAAAAPALESRPVPPTPVPPKPKPKPTPKPRQITPPRAKAPPVALPETTAPSPVAAAAPDSAPPAPAAPAAPAQAAPAIGRPTMAISAPKDVAHLECNIATPDYPVLSRRRGESGTAVVKFVVGLTGKIENIELKRSSGSSRLDDAALDAMRASACKPYKENGEAIRAAYSQPFVFGLNE